MKYFRCYRRKTTKAMRNHIEEMKIWAGEHLRALKWFLFQYKDRDLNPQNLCISRKQYHKFTCSQHSYRETESINENLWKFTGHLAWKTQNKLQGIMSQTR